MSARLDSEAEILKLARILDVDPATLDYLDGVDADALRTLRDGVTDMLFDIGGGLMARLGNAAKRLPTPVVATICERAFGPMLAARAAASTDPAKAVEIAQRLSPDFLTEVTVQLDPRRVAAIVSGVPTDLVAPVAAELGKRGEYVTMGRFLTFLGDDALEAALAELDDEAVLRTSFVLEDKSSVDQAIAALSPDRLRGVLRCASSKSLWPELLTLLDHLSPQHLADVAAVVADLPGRDVSALLTAVRKADLWESLLPAVDSLDAAARARLAATVAHDIPARQRAGIAEAADRLGLRAAYDAALQANS